MVKKESQNSNEYELQRQANIAKNKALLQELKLNAASAGIAPKSKSSKPNGTSSHKSSKPKPKVKQETTPIPTRSSSRLKGIVADSEVAKRKAEDERDRIEQENRAKRQRVSDDLNLDDILIVGDKQNWNKSGNWLRGVKPANPYERTFDYEDAVKQKTGSKEIKELREELNSLSLWKDVGPNRIKITPERIYAMGFHPVKEKQLVFAGDKLGNLGIFDGSQELTKIEAEDDEEGEEEYENPEITTFKPHTRTISSIFFSPSQPQHVYTSSYDSSIRKLDLEKGMSTELYAPTDLDVDEPLSGIQIPETEPHLLYFTSLNGIFGTHDVRTPGYNTELMTLSEKKIGGFSIHPLQPHLVATASLDRTLKLWDLRKITGKGENRHPTMVAEHESKLSVSHAAFNAAGQIATSSYDDTIKIHTLTNPSTWKPGHTLKDPSDFSPSTIIPHNNQTGRWVTILRPQWQPQPSPSNPGRGTQKFCIGNMNRFVDVYAATGEQLAQLGGDGITAVPSVAVFHHENDWIAAGTASGKLCLWC